MEQPESKSFHRKFSLAIIGTAVVVVVLIARFQFAGNTDVSNRGTYVVVGNLEVHLVSLTPVNAKDEPAGPHQDSDSKALVAIFRFINRSRGKARFKDWVSVTGSIDPRPFAYDDLGNIYHPISFQQLGIDIKQDIGDTTLGPGKMLNGAIAFKRPTIYANMLKIELAGEPFCADEPLSFQISNWDGRDGTLPPSIVTDNYSGSNYRGWWSHRPEDVVFGQSWRNVEEQLRKAGPDGPVLKSE